MLTFVFWLEVRQDLLKARSEYDAIDACRYRRGKHDKKIGGKPEIRAHLENLGFVTGGNVTVVSAMGGSLIVNVKESRVAISREMANKIMV